MPAPLAFFPTTTAPLSPLARARSLVAQARQAAEADLARATREHARQGETIRQQRIQFEVDALERRLARLARLDAAIARLAAAAGTSQGLVSRVCERVRWLPQLASAGDLEGLVHEIERLAAPERTARRDAAFAEAATDLTRRVQALEAQAAELAEGLRTPDHAANVRAREAVEATLRALAIHLRLRDRVDGLADAAGLGEAARREALALLAQALRPQAPEQLARLAAAVEDVAA